MSIPVLFSQSTIPVPKRLVIRAWWASSNGYVVDPEPPRIWWPLLAGEMGPSRFMRWKATPHSNRRFTRETSLSPWTTVTPILHPMALQWSEQTEWVLIRRKKEGEH